MAQAIIDDYLRCKQLERQLATVTRALADCQEQLDVERASKSIWKAKYDEVLKQLDGNYDSE